MVDFYLAEPPVLSRATFDRADEIRDQPERMLAGWPDAQVLCIDAAGAYPVRSEPETVAEDGHRVTAALRWRPARELAERPPLDAVFLAHTADTDLWTLRVEELAGETADPRFGATKLSADEAGLLTTALGILNWHDRARYSPVDGRETYPARGGWVRRSVTDGEEGEVSSADEFPRTDPAIITVVHDGADHILLGRQAVWPQRWFSTLAGFVEPGESLEQCVIREVREEVGITVSNPRYLGSQPWPFPRSLMVGFEAIGDPAQPLAFLDGEIGEAHWFHRDEVLDALSRGKEWSRATLGGDDSSESDPRRLLLPGSISIGRSLIKAWAGAYGEMES